MTARELKQPARFAAAMAEPRTARGKISPLYIHEIGPKDNCKAGVTNHDEFMTKDKTIKIHAINTANFQIIMMLGI